MSSKEYDVEERQMRAGGNASSNGDVDEKPAYAHNEETTHDTAERGHVATDQ